MKKPIAISCLSVFLLQLLSLVGGAGSRERKSGLKKKRAVDGKGDPVQEVQTTPPNGAIPVEGAVCAVPPARVSQKVVPIVRNFVEF